ncbi:helicase-related protein [Woodsholea maritima]|uniref:helicase-related protein n=1 Tax=Woodsholea maritima TaxID=240237 RepID=UPI00036B622F|nr:helicase-related protein [Woodsholea maritima]
MAAHKAPVTAVLGPTNTGKTHLALERMLGRSSGVIGLPLRLLAREIYDKVVKAKGAHQVALVTGEEKIVPPKARYYVCTVEAMPLDLRPAFVAIDEIQLCADPDRGHIFTERLLYARGSEETMLLGAATMAPIIRRHIPDVEIIGRERFSELSYGGPKKISKLARRTAIVAFSAEDVYSIAELIRRQRGGAAVVMGALSPRTRNAQVELYQSGEVDYLVATDAIGMGLNMDVDHVAFAAYNKFDGRRRRTLYPQEIGQIAGRAGRFRTDGTFGETADARPLELDIVKAVQEHDFEPTTRLFWRNHRLDFANVEALRNSLNVPSREKTLERVHSAIDEDTLEVLARDTEVRDLAHGRSAVERLWDVCRTPDFCKTTLDEHAGLIKKLFTYRMTGNGYLPDAWLEGQLKRLNKTEGDVDVLSQRLAFVRTWTYAANRNDWTKDPDFWRARTREVEDQLSDALHERLTSRFLDRRTSVLMKGLREKGHLAAGLDHLGEVTVEGHFVGRIEGLNFVPDDRGHHQAARAVHNAALKVVRPEINRRLSQLIKCPEDQLSLDDNGLITWEGHEVGRLGPSDNPIAPSVTLLGAELGSDELRARAEARLRDYVAHLAQTVLRPLTHLRQTLSNDNSRVGGLARGIAYRLVERFGAAPRRDLNADISALSPDERKQLRQAGIRIGEHAVFMPALLKPKAAKLNALLKAASEGDVLRALHPPAGRVSLRQDKARPAQDYTVAGYMPCGPVAVRLDMLEKLADEIREARKAQSKGRFALTPSMTSLTGCSWEDLREVLKSLGYRRMQKPRDSDAQNPPAPSPDTQEIWGGRKPKAGPISKTAPIAPVSVNPDSPFAALAALTLTPAQPPKSAKPGKKAAHHKAQSQSKTEPKAAPQKRYKSRRRAKPKPTPTTPAQDRAS